VANKVVVRREGEPRRDGVGKTTGLGFPNESGGQNQVRYAYFNLARRLAVELSGHVTVYDGHGYEHVQMFGKHCL
jgi:hypothetical protein